MPVRRPAARGGPVPHGGDLALAAVESLPAGVLVHRADGEVVFTNHRGREALGDGVTRLEEVERQREHAPVFRALSRLLPTIAHEIKNPLASIQSVAEVLLDEIAGEQHRRDLESILAEVHRLRLLVDRMGLADQCLTAEGPAVDLVPTAQRALHLARHRARHRGVALEYAGAASLEAPIRSELLLSVLQNLLNNSLDACRAGDTVTVSLSGGDDGLQLTVRDTGEGMPAQVLRQATDLFFTTRPHGSGIGLALIREIVDRSGGRLAIASRPGEGTEVAVGIPGERA